MDIISGADLVFFQLLAACTFSYLSCNYFRQWRRTTPEPLIPPSKHDRVSPKGTPVVVSRSISRALGQMSKQCIVFYGSQTGTAEKLALQFCKEAKVRFGIECLLADTDEYDYDDLISLSDDKAGVFLLATYGEGEPTDNAVAFNHFIQACSGMEDTRKPRLTYAGFGLGNSSYQYYNEMIKRVDLTLSRRGCRKIGTIGLGDDGSGTLEENFTTWTNATLPLLARYFNLEERPSQYQPSFLLELSTYDADSDTFLGEPNKFHLRGKSRGPYSFANPYCAQVIRSYAICPRSSRQFLHLELDLSGSTLNYETGDHLAIRAFNSNHEVDRFLRVFGLTEIRNRILNLSTTDSLTKLPLPSKTTYDSIARYYLDICAPASRRLLASFVTAAPNSEACDKLTSLVSDINTFKTQVLERRLNVAQVLELCGALTSWQGVHFSTLLESLPALKPRYYSISSSPLVARRTVSITAVVDAGTFGNGQEEFRGVATGYLAALSSAMTTNLKCEDRSRTQTHQLTGPRQRFIKPTCLVHVRRSNFKMPRNISIPIIMIGPGTGVAPFRGFVQERAQRCREGRSVGRTLLFYGCRRSDEDYLYEEEWKEYATAMAPEIFRLHVAFSRQNPGKGTYVQHLLEDHAEELRDLILNKNAHIYVCGDAHRMARDVFNKVREILNSAPRFGGDSTQAEGFMKQLKAEKRWLEDVW